VARRPAVRGGFFALTVLGFVLCIFGFADMPGFND
jgi:hypothetical protein